MPDLFNDHKQKKRFSEPLAAGFIYLFIFNLQLSTQIIFHARVMVAHGTSFFSTISPGLVGGFLGGVRAAVVAAKWTPLTGLNNSDGGLNGHAS